MTAVTRTLVLNSEWRPINIVPVVDAVMKVFNGRALFVDPDSFRTYQWEDWILEWQDAIRFAKIEASRVMPLSGWSLVLPEVIVCRQYNGMGFKVNGRRNPKFSRKNLWIRDRGMCQFCGVKFPSKELTMDHVIPRSKGGKTCWTNIVMACVACNNRKRDRLPHEAGMRLIRKPVAPTAEDLRLSPMERIRMKIKSRPPKTWEQFLGKMAWTVELEND